MELTTKCSCFSRSSLEKYTKVLFFLAKQTRRLQQRTVLSSSKQSRWYTKNTVVSAEIMKKITWKIQLFLQKYSRKLKQRSCFRRSNQENCNKEQLFQQKHSRKLQQKTVVSAEAFKKSTTNSSCFSTAFKKTTTNSSCFSTAFKKTTTINSCFSKAFNKTTTNNSCFSRKYSCLSWIKPVNYKAQLFKQTQSRKLQQNTIVWAGAYHEIAPKYSFICRGNPDVHTCVHLFQQKLSRRQQWSTDF